NPSRGRPRQSVVDSAWGLTAGAASALGVGSGRGPRPSRRWPSWVVEVERGTAVDPSRQTLGEYLCEWLADVEASLRPSPARHWNYTIRPS
ncbi:MAG: hypothetical protein OEW56_12210, partial [Gemmatimonadota bacterium]|nr:hypothetical protein [Gemmatimonadota bacterium]